jgi:HAD superfamily hydrolase (TIGR01509 family)
MAGMTGRAADGDLIAGDRSRSPSSVDAVIFDVDGTLIDSVNLHAMAWSDAFHDFGHWVPPDKVRSHIGKGGDQLLPVFLTQREIDKYGQRLETHRGVILKQRYLCKMTPFPDVRRLLERLRSDRIQIALASSAKEDELATYKKIANIEDLIDVQTSSDDAERSKPFPDIFRAALGRLGGPKPQRAIAVGDTPYDAEAAGKTGLTTIGMLCGGWTEDDLRAAGCIAIYKDPADLLTHYKTSPLMAGSAVP